VELIVLPQDEQSENCQQVGEEIWQDDTGCGFHRHFLDIWTALRRSGEEYSEEMSIDLEIEWFLNKATGGILTAV
jgi:hypothetical protein